MSRCDLTLHPRTYGVVCQVLNSAGQQLFQEFTRACGMTMLVDAIAHNIFEGIQTNSPFGLHWLFHTILFALNPSGASRSATEVMESYRTMVQSTHFDKMIQSCASYLIRAPSTGLRSGTQNGCLRDTRKSVACLTAREGAVVALLNYSKGLRYWKPRVGIEAVQKQTLDSMFFAMVVTLCNFRHEDAKVVRDSANFFFNCKTQHTHLEHSCVFDLQL